MKKIGIRILANAGYSANQVNGVTLGELRDFIDEMIEYYDEDTEVVTVDDGNRYGANYGRLYLQDVLEDEEEEEEE